MNKARSVRWLRGELIVSLLLISLLSFRSQPSGTTFGPTGRPPLIPSNWTAFAHQGVNDWGRSFLVDGDTLYVGGRFTQTNDGAVTNLNTIARYNLTTNTWSGLANNGLAHGPIPFPQVWAMELIGDDLFVGGAFDRTFDGTVTNLNYIARYNTATNTWTALAHNGLNSSVSDLLVIGSDLYVAGGFTQTADGLVTNLNGVARYDTTTNTWNPLAHNGLDGGVNAFALVGNDLYIGGNFTQTADGAVTNLNAIARYNIGTTTWSALANEGLNGGVEGLAVVGSHLYVGGTFNFTHDLTIGNMTNIGRYNMSTNTWSALANNGVNGGATIHDLVAAGTDLYVGGEILTQTNDGAVTNLNNIAHYDTLSNTWHPLPNNGLNNRVFTLHVGAGRLFVGGDFTQSFDGSVTGLGWVAMLGGDLPPQVINVTPNGTVSGSITNLQFTFSENVKDPAGNSEADDVTNPDNYLLVQKGIDGTYNTTGCSGVAGDDVSIPDGPASYNAASYISTIVVNGGAPLALGEYRGFVCGTTSIVDPFENPLGGGVDYPFDFTIVSAPAAAPVLPSTGFAPGIKTFLPDQPLEKSYLELGDLWLEIPSLGVQSTIVGVPRLLNGWDVSWLGDQVGWLEGTAFPTWAGNTALTAHVYDANGKPGPFIDLGKMFWGQKIFVHAWGLKYVYEVRTISWWTSPTDLRAFKHEVYDWITLVTCRGYEEDKDTYRWRTVVRAVLVDVLDE